MPPHNDGADIVVEDESFPTVEEIIPHNEKARSDFSKSPADEFEPVESEMGVAALAELRAKFNIPAYIDLIPAGRDAVQVHRPGYCVFYAYPLYVGYSLPPLVEEFCRYYGVCPA